jgi:serine/threonine protein kinase
MDGIREKDCPALKQGQSFGDGFVLERRLGSGGMGEVWLASEPELKREIAVKILHDTGATQDDDTGRDDRDIRRFHREASILAACEHPAILPVYRVGRDKTTGRLYYATRACILNAEDVRHVCVDVLGSPFPESIESWDSEPRALSLADILSKGKTIPEKAVAHIGRRLVDAVAYAHSLPQPVYHRDIKPSNILFTPDGDIVLSDFGIAKRVHADGSVSSTLSTTSSERRGLFIGTFAYAAPEQRNGQGSSPSVDYFSIAAVLYEALTGQRPRSLVAPSEFDPKHISGLWDALLAAMLASDPDRRLTDPAAIDRALALVESGRCQWKERCAKFFFFLKRITLGMVLVLAIFLAIAGILAFMEGRLRQRSADGMPGEDLSTPPQPTPAPSSLQEDEDFNRKLKNCAAAMRDTARGRLLSDEVRRRRAGEVRVIPLPNGESIPFVWCRNTELGSDIYDFKNYDDSLPIPDIEAHGVVVVTNFYWMAQTEVTRAQWAAVMGTPAPQAGGNLPALCSFHDAERFVDALNALGVATNATFAIPTEMQWEHACRGMSLKYFGNKKSLDVGWFAENAEGALHPVAQKGKMGYGVYDAHGNAAEWCRDGFAPQEEGPLVEPFTPPKAADTPRVVRGGSIHETVSEHFAMFRRGVAPDNKSVGLRIVLSDGGSKRAKPE